MSLELQTLNQIAAKRDFYAVSVDSFDGNKQIDVSGMFPAATLGTNLVVLDIEEPTEYISTVDNVDPFDDDSGVALYKLDGNTLDSGGNYNGTPTNITYTTGKHGTSAVFDEASSTLVTLAIPAPAGGVGAVSFWGTSDADTSAVYIGATNYSFRRTSTRIYIYGASNFSVFNGASLVTSTFSHIVVMFDGSKPRLFINKVEQTSQDSNVTGGMTDITRLGEKGNGNEGLTGKMDQVRVFNKQLTTKEIEILYNEKIERGLY